MKKPKWAKAKHPFYTKKWLFSNREDAYLKLHAKSGDISIADAARFLGRRSGVVSGHLTKLRIKWKQTTEICGKMVKCGKRPEIRPCWRPKGHGAYCSPDLTGMMIGSLAKVEKLAFSNSDGAYWRVKWPSGFETIVSAVLVTHPSTRGFCSRSEKSRLTATYGNVKAEYVTVIAHRSFLRTQKAYKDMPYDPEWKEYPIVGLAWILENLGTKAAWAKNHNVSVKDVSMHVIKHEVGFVPGNLEWQTRRIQNRSQAHDRMRELERENTALREENVKLKQKLAANG